MSARSRIHFALTLVVMVFIFIQSALPGNVSGAESNFLVHFIAELTGMDPEPLSLIVRKTAHFTEYLILGVCLTVDTRNWARDHHKTVQEKHLMLSAWILGTVYAVNDEIHQVFVPDRVCAIMDMGIDAIGAACGVIIVGTIKRRHRA